MNPNDLSATAGGNVALGPEAYFLDALSRGDLKIQRCTETGRYVFYPRAVSPWSGRPTLEWVPATGRGTVYATTIIRQKPDKGGDYNVVLVDLEEGVRMMSRVEGITPNDVTIGMAVKAKIGREGDRPIVLFEPIAS